MSNASIFETLNKQLDGFSDAFTEEFLSRVKRRTPVASGRLQAGWQAESTDTEITIANEVPYAAHVEYGTKNMDPSRMLTTTIAEADDIAVIAARKVGLDVR